MKVCNICHKISATGQDHLDCIQKRRIELENEEFKLNIPEKLQLSKDSDLGKEVKAILDHLSKQKDQ